MNWRWLLVASLLCGSAGRLQAQASPAAPSEDRTEEAKGLFNAGRAAFDAGRYPDALDYFQRSYAISGRAALLYNIGLAFDRMREDEHALAAYEQYLARAPEAQNRVEVETRAAAIRSALERRQQRQAEPKAPTPSETAAAAPAPAAQDAAPLVAADDSAQVDRDDSGLLSQWWFWAAAGVVVAGGVAVGVIALSGSDDPQPVAPKSGIVVTTLRSSP